METYLILILMGIIVHLLVMSGFMLHVCERLDSIDVTTEDISNERNL